MKITDSTLITSKDNPRIKLARAVRDGREKGMIFVEGVRLASELLKSESKAKAVFVSDDLGGKTDELVSDLVRETGAEVLNVASRIFDSITDTDNSQGIIVLAERPENPTIEFIAAERGIILYLSRINNPSNLGAVIRAAEAAGATGMVTSPGSADPFSPKALRASMGSALRVPICTEITIDKAIAYARSNAIRTLAADINGRSSYTEVDLRLPTMLVFGSEAHGLDAHELELLDETVFIPMGNGVESLNLAVSAGILLFEAKRQRDLE